MWNDITVDVINVECDPEESNQGGIEPGPSFSVPYFFRVSFRPNFPFRKQKFSVPQKIPRKICGNGSGMQIPFVPFKSQSGNLPPAAVCCVHRGSEWNSE